MIVYLIHFSRKLGHARHYIGTTRVYQSRMKDHHSKGRGAAILRACNKQKIKWRVVRKWFGSRTLEKQLKARKDAAALCPVCKRTRSAYNKRLRRKSMASTKDRTIINAVACPTCKAQPGKVCTTIRGVSQGQTTSIHPRRRIQYAAVTKMVKAGVPIPAAEVAHD